MIKIPLALICIVLTAFSCTVQKKSADVKNETRSITFRLKPGEDLRKSIEQKVAEENIQAGWIASCAGSLTTYNIRFANQSAGFSEKGHFEIVSLSGTVSVNGSHIHISISDSTGKTTGGHLLPGNIIYTTAEIVISYNRGLVFTREKDGTTDWEELQIRKADH